MNAGWSFKNSSELFDEIANTIEPFKGMNYKLLDEYQGLKFGMAHKPDAKIRNYESHYMKPN